MIKNKAFHIKISFKIYLTNRKFQTYICSTKYEIIIFKNPYQTNPFHRPISSLCELYLYIHLK